MRFAGTRLHFLTVLASHRLQRGHHGTTADLTTRTKHGVDLGTNYHIQTAGSSFIHYSAEAIREELHVYVA